MGLSYKKLVIKIGSNVLATENGLPDVARMAQLINEIAALKKEGPKIERTAHSIQLGELPPAVLSTVDFDDDIIE